MESALFADVESQHDSEKQTSSQCSVRTGMLQGTALQTLFGFDEEQMRYVEGKKGAFAWCRYLERAFEPLLADDYACIWEDLGLPRPTATVHCWPLFRSVCKSFTRFDAARISIEEIWDSVRLSPNADETTEGPLFLSLERTCGDAPLIAIFAMICWGSMILTPRLLMEEQRASSFHLHQLPAGHSGSKMSMAEGPVAKLFKGLQRCIAELPSNLRATSGVITSLFISTVNYHSLQAVGRVRLTWVDSISDHLKFDPRTRSLSVFRFPSFCALTVHAEGRIPLFESILEQLCPMFDAQHDECSQLSLQLSREVLMSYRLLFGQTKASRKLCKTILERELIGQCEFDDLLSQVCTEPCKAIVRDLPDALWPLCCRDLDGKLEESDCYILEHAFPMLGRRLAVIQAFNLRHQPHRLRDLWKDRRNPSQWYTFWAVVIIGGLSLILAVLQLAAGIVQAVRS